jgi:hypothetical protein
MCAAPTNPHFEVRDTVASALDLLAFRPLVPRRPPTTLRSVAVHVRDHRGRLLPVDRRTLEMHFDDMVVSQTKVGSTEALRLAMEVTYGRQRRRLAIGANPAMVYDLGPVPPPEDIDGRSPAVVVWADGDMIFLIASVVRSAGDLVDVAGSMYD